MDGPALDRATIQYATFIAHGGGSSRPADLSVAASGEAYVSVADFVTEVVGSTPSGGIDTIIVSRVFLTKISPAGDQILFHVSPGRGGRPSVTTDQKGNAYVTGVVSGEFTTTPGALNQGGPGFLVKYNPFGEKVLAARMSVLPLAIAVDSAQNIYVTGQAAEGFTATPGAFQTAPSPGGCSRSLFQPMSCSEAFVAQLARDGSSFEWATFLGGKHDEIARSIGVDSAGSVIVVGETGSSDFPGAERQRFGGVVEVSEMKLGDGFVAKLHPLGTSLVYSSFLSGAARDEPADVYVSGMGSAVVVGTTMSADFPTSAGAAGPGAFVVRFGPSGPMEMSTVIPDISPTGVSELPMGELVIGAFGEGTCSSVGRLLRLSPNGIVLSEFTAQHWDHGFDTDADGNVYASGLTSTPLAVTKNAALRGGGRLISKFSLKPSNQPTLISALNAASNVRRSTNPRVSPGEIISLFGTALGPANGASFEPPAAPTALAGTVVSINDQPIPLLYSGDCQVNAVVPFGLEPGRATLQVTTQGGTTSRSRVDVVQSQPGFFEVEKPRIVNRGGTHVVVPGRVAALNEDGTLNSPQNPARRDSIVSLFLTGLNSLDPVPADGSIIAMIPPFPRVTGRFQAFIAARTATGATGLEVLYAGAAPGAIAGLIQMNVRIPALAESGDRVLVKVVSAYPYGESQGDVGISVR